MRLRRPIAFILSAAVAASALTGCDSFSGHAAAAANSAQVQQLIEFIADLGLERDLRQALQSGGDLRQALLTLLGLENAVNFNVDDLAGARPGQHAVQVWEVTAQSAEDAAALAASQIRAVLEQLKSNGVTAGRIGMVEVDGKYYVVVDVEVTEENTFEPIRPASDDDDDSDDDNEDTPSVSAKGVKTADDKIFDVSELRGEIDAQDVLNIINEGLSGEEKYDKDDIIELDLSGCKNLTSIGNPRDIPKYGAFADCKKLTTVILPSSVTTIGPHAFRGCNSLTSINLSACTNLQRISIYAFAECDSLKEINLSNCTGLTSIGEGTFQYCTSLNSITLPASLTTINFNAFEGCSSLTEIDLSNTKVNTIGNYAFAGCSSLTEIDLSNTKVNTIGNYAFIECTNLKKVLLPANLTTIGGWTFDGCSSLETVLLPAKLTTIGGWAFNGCSGLKNIYFYTVPNTIEMFAFSGVNASGLTVYYSGTCDLTELKEALRNKGFSGDFKDFIQGPPPLAYLLGL